jgi:hypothetical protein
MPVTGLSPPLAVLALIADMLILVGREAGTAEED